MPVFVGSAVALPALGGQQETAQSCGAGLASAGPSPPRAAVLEALPALGGQQETAQS